VLASDTSDVAHLIVVASVAEYFLYEFGLVSRPFTTLFGILENVGAAGRTVRTARAKRSRAPGRRRRSGLLHLRCRAFESKASGENT
jgi:hypothetical protein